MKVKVAINGYGTIGKRVADAVAKQDDMELIGVAKTKPDFEATSAIKKGYNLFAIDVERASAFREAKIPIQGTLQDLLKKVDIVVDCTPGGVGAINKPMYEKAGLKAIFEGGEKHALTQLSFVAQCNYSQALGKQFVRVVSCNTTGLCRTLNTIDQAFGIKRAQAVVIRRGADPAEIKKGPINAIVPDPPTIPSHHGPDVKTVLPHLNITTIAVAVPTTIMHMHAVMAELKTQANPAKIISAFEEAPRIKVVSAKDGFESTAQLIEFARDFGRSRYDLYEICV
ncbi:MAG: type II glyceraldehyde-3-phosphate dehydrogenase, partial [Euryarchaeota archaeon]|nr:type II glyceraldehyde-3-phosphate dehydrogenase [Euryarchaeota archaeon]